MLRLILAPLTVSVILAGCAGNSATIRAVPTRAAADTTAAKAGGSAAKATGPQPYAKVIPAKATTDSGLFVVRQGDNKIYWEIPDSLLGRDMLWLTRLAAVAQDLSGFTNAGSNINEYLVHFERDGDRILLRSQGTRYIADSTLPIARSVAANTFAPILQAFDLKARTNDSMASVIDVTSFLDGDVAAISGLETGLRTQFKVRRMDPARSFVESVKSFPQNLEVRQIQTFDAAEPPSQRSTGTISITTAQSLVLLPREPMRPRFADERVGWFALSQIDFGSKALKADERRLIQRWRLEPRDPAAYARGELTEPIKQIVFYLDPGTPTEWRPYIRQGVEDWNQAFEAAGFKNAIVAKDPPTTAEDPEFDPDDVRYSTVRYIANMTRNAMGPSVADPRTGEIIESDIIWYHNHLRSYRNRLMVETGAANPGARSLDIEHNLIGETVRQVIAHEIGHALGLPHNMIASSSFPVDSLRSPSFTSEYGVAPSIMDYARQNYVAQPGDGVTRFIRKIGPYDKYAINWGYRRIPNTTAISERPTLDRWIAEKSDDPRYRFFGGDGMDPRAQTEDIGGDPVMASTYGIMNLKRVLPQLPAWTATPGQNWDDLEELYGELVSSYARYVGHVITMIGGIERTAKSTDQAGPVYVPVTAENQRRAVKFLADEVFTTPTWMVESDVLRRIEGVGAMDRVRQAQASALNRVLDATRMQRMVEVGLYADGPTYGPAELLADVRAAVWGELNGRGAIDPWRRQLQRVHVDRLISLATAASAPAARGADVSTAEARPLAREELRTLQSAITARIRRGGDAATRAHLEDLSARIREALDPR
ncbi:MAG TPA: zinc-dependent metalloprotease [Gemmatimonadales bacterium]|nr:zinc-dependent metalloprotease [Gemmatimonadales bacterium]